MRTSLPILSILCWATLTVGVAKSDVGTDARCGFTDQRNLRHAQAIAAGIASSNPRPSLPFFVDAPSGRFRVHFSRTGVDAVPAADIDGSGLEDYVEEAIAALDRSYALEVTSMGYAQPLDDADSGGTGALDVYLRDLSKAGGTGLYGVTRLERVVGTNDPWDRYVSFMEVDNDFAPTDRNAFDSLIYTKTNGLAALRVTCAHEFHHVLQLAGYGFTGTQLMLYELTSTWMEQVVYPDILDWHTYTAALLRVPEGYPFSRGDALNGYAWGWFGWVLHDQSESLLRRTWERIGQGQRPFAALTDACRDAGTTFSDLFCTSMPSLYATASRGATNDHLRSAELLPELRLKSDERVTPPSSIVDGTVRPFEVQAMRFMLPGLNGRPVSTVVMTTQRNEATMISGETFGLNYTVLATSDPRPGDVDIAGTTWGIRHDGGDAVCTSVSGVGTTSPEGPYPQPFDASAHDAMRFPVPYATPGDAVTIDVRSASLGGAITATVTVELDGDRVVAAWPGARALGTGIYIVEVRHGNHTDLHKVMVRR